MPWCLSSRFSIEVHVSTTTQVYSPVPCKTTKPSKWLAELRMSLAILIQAIESILEEPTRGSSAEA